MGLLDAATSKINNARDQLNQALGVNQDLDSPIPVPDFPDGFQFVEIVNGREQTRDKVKLIGNLMPFQPFEFGGEQTVVKDYYPGNSEPVVQVLNPKEDDLTIRGRFKDKKYKTKAARGLATELQQQIDGIRIRGNLLKITMGEFKRYGFLQKTSFKMKTLADVEYELTFSIVGFNKPLQCFVLDTQESVPFEINKDLIASLEALQAEANSIPASTPRSIFDVLNDAISDVAGAVSAVTGFIDDVVSNIEDISAVLNRAAGLVRHAQGEVIRFQRRLGNIKYSVSTLTGISVGRRYSSTSNISNLQGGANDLQAFLASLRDRFAQLRATTPLARYRIKDGDTLQKIANKFYANSEEWERIYDHNKLTSTALENGTVLEIPRI